MRPTGNRRKTAENALEKNVQEKLASRADVEEKPIRFGVSREFGLLRASPH